MPSPRKKMTFFGAAATGAVGVVAGALSLLQAASKAALKPAIKRDLRFMSSIRRVRKACKIANLYDETMTIRYMATQYVTLRFVYAPKDNRLVAGTIKHYVESAGSRHEQLAAALGVAIDTVIVGGMLARKPNGDFLTSEQSGHFGDVWTPAIRDQFHIWLSARLGVPVIHHYWGR